MSYQDEIIRASKASVVEKDFIYQYKNDKAFRENWDKAIVLKNSVAQSSTSKTHQNLLAEVSMNPQLKIAVEKIFIPLLNANSMWSKEEYLNIQIDEPNSQTGFKNKFNAFTNASSYSSLFYSAKGSAKSLVHGYLEGEKIAAALNKGERYNADLKDFSQYEAAYFLYILMKFFNENEELYLYDSNEPERKVYRLKFLLNSLFMDMFQIQRTIIFFKVINENPTFSPVPIASSDVTRSSLVEKTPYKLNTSNGWFRYTFTVNDPYNEALPSKRDIHKLYKTVHDSLMEFKNAYYANQNKPIQIFSNAAIPIRKVLEDVLKISSNFFTQTPPERLVRSKVTPVRKTSVQEETLRIIKSLPKLASLVGRYFQSVTEDEINYFIDIPSISFFEEFTKNPVMVDGFANNYDLYESLNQEERQAILEPVNNTGIHETKWVKIINNHRSLRKFLFVSRPNINYTLRSGVLALNYSQIYESANIVDHTGQTAPSGSHLSFSYWQNGDGIFHVPYFYRNGDSSRRSERIGSGLLYDTKVVTLSFLKRLFPLVYSNGYIYSEKDYLNEKEVRVKAQLQAEVSRLELLSLQAVGELDVERNRVFKLQEELKRAIDSRNSKANNINELLAEKGFLIAEIEKINQEVEYQYLPLLKTKREALERQT